MAKELQRLRQGLRTLKRDIPKILDIALISVQSEMVKRIHSKGQDANGNKIGNYSTTPISVSKKNQPRSSGKTYFSGGYKSFKQSMGLESGFVNLELTGQMRQDLTIIPLTPRSSAIGFKNPFNADKSDWMENKYKKPIYENTKKELKIFNDVFDFETMKRLR